MPTKKQQYIAEYDAQNCKGVYLKLNKIHDTDILAKLNSVENKQGYIKQLIREDIKRGGGKA